VSPETWGSQTITATDITTSSITGSAILSVVFAGLGKYSIPPNGGGSNTEMPLGSGGVSHGASNSAASALDPGHNLADDLLVPFDSSNTDGGLSFSTDNVFLATAAPTKADRQGRQSSPLFSITALLNE
jgi:hypothetical protein